MGLPGRYEVLELEYAEAKAECERRGEMLNEVTQYTELLEVRVRQVDEEHAAYRQRMEQERDTLKVRAGPATAHSYTRRWRRAERD
jgi:hypothetical protein